MQSLVTSRWFRPLFYTCWFILLVVQAAFTQLMDDEAYYWVYAQNLHIGYYDHPPMIALFIRCGYVLFKNESIETPDDTTLHMVVQFMPTFKECKNIKDDGERQNCFNKKLFEFIGQNIHYPEMARTNNITGKVYIAFVVEKNGAISSVKVLRDIGGGCGDEAARVISLLPTMEPGRNNGRPQRVAYQIPINFELGNK